VSANKPYRVALVGCGRISKNHFEAIDKVDGLELVAADSKGVSCTGDRRMRRWLPAAVALDDQAALPPKTVRCVNEPVECGTLRGYALHLRCC